MDPADADKKRSYSTLNTLYHESRQEMELLAKQLAAKDNIIAELKLRLAGHERLCLSVGDNQSVVVGPSKSLLDSLCKEIYKLKQKSNETDLKVVRQEEEIQRLSEQLCQKDEQLESVKCGAKSPGELNGDPEKELELRRLRSAEATRTVLCTSLAEEAEQLRGQLGATVQVCRQLMAKLEKSKAGKAQAGEQAATQPPESPDRSTNSQIRQLEDENRQLKQRVAYVQGLNSQWQKYDSSREDYIRGLCQRLKSVAATRPAPSLASAGAGAALLHQEISRLNGLLEDKLSECARLRGEAQEASSKDRERIQTLEQQVLIYTEDFKSERADRERAQGRIQDLKEQICHLKQQLHKQGSTRETREVPVCHVHIGHRVSSSSSSRRHHRDVGDCSGVRNNTPRLLAPSAAVPSPPAPSPPVLPQDAALMEVPSDLQCPRCLATFSEDDAARYLNHCEECATL
ncbi:TNFAIP3-interacting protein 2 [Hippocampus comes]|uniref:TNFAIP3-interacting protein 2 n=1 Tax=Hippocampus comes TaxID=109280 RepID=A0A3Q2XYZ3_HIPCM|nr:PREDICTED: TNFAIP3-interacting protein 2 [Hippocampus comes]